jgi:hypothetical protein
METRPSWGWQPRASDSARTIPGQPEMADEIYNHLGRASDPLSAWRRNRDALDPYSAVREMRRQLAIDKLLVRDAVTELLPVCSSNVNSAISELQKLVLRPAAELYFRKNQGDEIPTSDRLTVDSIKRMFHVEPTKRSRERSNPTTLAKIKAKHQAAKNNTKSSG